MPKPRNTEEADLQASIIGEAERLGWIVYHTRNSIGSNPGFPDLAMIRSAYMILSELKTDEGEFSDDQKVWRERALDVEEGCLDKENPCVRFYTWRPKHWKSGEIQKVLA